MCYSCVLMEGQGQDSRVLWVGTKGHWHSWGRGAQERDSRELQLRVGGYQQSFERKHEQRTAAWTCSCVHFDMPLLLPEPLGLTGPRLSHMKAAATALITA